MTQKRFRPRLLLACLLTLILIAPAARAFDLEIAVGGGYDDNPREERHGSGAGFSEARIELSRDFSPAALPDTVFTLQGFAGGRLYGEDYDNTWMAGGELDSSTPLGQLPLRLEFFLAGATFNNPGVDDDDFNQLKTGGRLVWFLSSRLTLEWENFLSWEDYGADTEVTGPGSPHKSVAGSGSGTHKGNGQGRKDPSSGPGHRPRHHNRGERSDRVTATALRALLAINPFWDGIAEIFWQGRHSSLDAEKSHSYGLRLDLFWHPLERLETTLSLNAARTPYNYRLRGEKRCEKSYGSTINLSWKLSDHWSLAGSWDWYRQDSDLNNDEYTRNQWNASLNFSF